jgi:murein DD-endopeptidase MepM/ murein hydrolase activator NlpD
MAALCLSACSRGSVAKLDQRLALGPPAAAVADSAPGTVVEEPPSLKKVVHDPPPPRWAPPDPAWSYVLPLDYGIRADEGGSGHFLAPRKHGKHNGVDFLAPVGTATFAACDGKARTAMRGGYGRTVQLVCKLPADLGGDRGLYVSLFYAHLDKSTVPDKWTPVKSGAKIGAVGKTGNAAGPKIKPHLHLEAIIRTSEEEAMNEKHAGVDPKAGSRADSYFEALRDKCLSPAHFSSTGDVRRERRADPFMLLVCAAKPKPDLVAPPDEHLREAAVRWSEHYAALGFDVDAGPRKLD